MFVWLFDNIKVMSSVEDSEKDEDSLSKEEPQFLRTNRLSRQRSHHRSTRTNEQEDTLYHEAFRIYMFGGFEKASEKCKRIIAMNPQNPKPYFLLASMHEEAAKSNQNINQLHKAVEYYFFDAFYSPPDIQKWLKVGEMAYELELHQQAAYCYGRVLKINSSRIDISLKRAECLELCNEDKKAGGIYKRIIEKVSNSVEVYKKYAKLLFSKRAYSKARQILRMSPDASHDTNIKYMICETLLKQKNYEELYKVIEEEIIDGAEPPVADIYSELVIPFIQMLLICTIALPRKLGSKFSPDRLWKQLMQHYEEEDNPDLYEELVTHVKDLGSVRCYDYAEFLLSYEPHKTIDNYMLVSEHLRDENLPKAIKIINQGLKFHKTQNSIELRTQLNYLRSLQTQKNKKGSWRTSGMINPIRKAKNNEDDIFESDEEPHVEPDKKRYKSSKMESNESEGSLNNYPTHKYEKEDSLFKEEQSQEMQEEEEEQANNESEDEEDDSLSEVKRIQGGKSKKITKERQVRQKTGQLKNPEMVQQLIKNSRNTLTSFKIQYQHAMQNYSTASSQTLNHIMDNIEQSLNYIVNIQGFSRNIGDDGERVNKRGLFSSKNPNKRKRNAESQKPRINLILGNEEDLTESVKCGIFFMREALREEKHEHVLTLAELLSRAHFFKWQNKLTNFQQLKIQIYEIAVVSCLSLRKYKKSLFFLRFLINKFPNNLYYLTLIEKVTRHRFGKLTLNYIKKDAVFEENPSDGIYILYLKAIEEMDNGYFELSLNMFTTALNLATTSQIKVDTNHFLKVIYLSMSTCLLQLASSRTVYSKLDYVNRSAFCFAKYQEYARIVLDSYGPVSNNSEGAVSNNSDGSISDQILYNQGRWFSHVKAYRQAIRCFEQIDSENSKLRKQAGLNLMVIYKEMEEFKKVQDLSLKYFSN